MGQEMIPAVPPKFIGEPDAAFMHGKARCTAAVTVGIRLP